MGVDTVDLAPSLIAWLDLFGIAVFAASGALAAARRQQTLVTFSFFALVTGVGGGTVRDLLIGAPVFWVHDWRVPAVCLATAGLIWVTPAHFWKGRALDWFDAVGMAVYAVFGAAKSLSFGVPLLPAMMMGVITACVGGIIRDVLAGEPSILLRPELYVTAAALAAALFVILAGLGVPLIAAALIGAVSGFGLRALAITRGLAIPSYKR
ncbi:MAG: trimeric intracellular cation channel family protein [Sphingomonadales bacterium]|nr:trimeric intracellular cation channel family protein [Sphingomonadales bacterium]MBK6490930.1 trimeric intracellular cation channel family protein [Sphingomonadales bacterium]MBK6719117.1 trimeric intracellular cation channel family protein [Sphingomonadales bacterium]